MTWENGDGARHNFVIEDADGNGLKSTQPLSQRGDTLSLEFTASEEMAGYYCNFHPQSMRGSIEVTSEGDGAGQTDNATAGNQTANDGGRTEEQELSPPIGLAASVLRDDALAPENIIERETVSWDDIASESKEFDQGGD